MGKKGKLRETKIGFLYALICGIIFGLMPFMTVIFTNFGFDIVSCGFYRIFFSTVIFFIIHIFFNKGSLKLTKKEIIYLLFTALTFALTVIFLFTSYLYISTGIATALHFFNPAITFILTMLILKEKPKRMEVVSIIAASLAVFFLGDIFSIGGDNFSKEKLIGFTFAVLSAVTFSLNCILFETKVIKNIDSIKMLFYMNFFACFMMYFYGTFFANGINFNFTIPSFLYGVFYALCLTVIATYLLQRAIKKIGAKKTSIITMVEPCISIIVGSLVLHETITVNDFIAVGLILMAGFVLVKGQKS